jgi:hypothetical protein
VLERIASLGIDVVFAEAAVSLAFDSPCILDASEVEVAAPLEAVFCAFVVSTT